MFAVTGKRAATPLPSSWPASCRPSTACVAGIGKGVDGRAKSGHDEMRWTEPGYDTVSTVGTARTKQGMGPVHGIRSVTARV